MPKPLNLMIYDATCTGRGALPGLSDAWYAGATLYRLLARFDAAHGVRTWDEGLRWLAEEQPKRPIGSIQFWGHGKWGKALVDGEALGEASLAAEHPHRPWLDAIGARMAGDSLWWFRTCETFGALAGHDFARAWSRFFGCRAASHTYIIGAWQSGLHSLEPGEEPRWRADEGLVEGDPSRPARARWSGPLQPNTITCLRGSIPDGY